MTINKPEVDNKVIYTTEGHLRKMRIKISENNGNEAVMQLCLPLMQVKSCIQTFLIWILQLL